MKFGLYLNLRNPGASVPWPEHYEKALRLCEQAETWGASSIWLSEHHGFADGYLPQPLTLAAAIAARTNRLRIGTAVLIAPLRHPVQLAEEAAVVDILSGGRLDLGLGGGYRDDESALYGRAPSDSPLAELFDRADAVSALWTDERVTPPPVQRPIPVWMGCNGPIGARRTGRSGRPLLSVRRRLAEHYLHGLAEAGHDRAGARMSGPVNIFLADDPETARPWVAAAYDRLWRSYGSSVDSTEALAKGLRGGLSGLVIATPEHAARRLGTHFAGMPVETVFSWAVLPGVPEELLARHCELWSAELPAHEMRPEGTESR